MDEVKSVLELPVVGARAYAAIEMALYQAADAPAVCTLAQGTTLTILAEQGDYWQVRVVRTQSPNMGDALNHQDKLDESVTLDSLAQGDVGYVLHKHCFINLPDVLPSAIYNNTNAVASEMRSTGLAIPGITGEQLYQSLSFNSRFGVQTYTMPVLYHAAKKLAAAQKTALAQGNSLVVYELFRMQHVQQRVVRCLSAFAEENPAVMQAISAEPWELDWFISTGVSKHQRGMAMDLGLAKVQASEMRTLPDGATYRAITDYTLYEMPTPIHELGCASASMAYPVTSRNDEAWRSAPLAPTMNESACLLRNYCTGAGLSPLASEWWHFNDLEAEQLDGTECFLLPEETV